MERGHVRDEGETESVGAVVVTYHPDQEVAGNLALLRRQVDHVIVVDNGSPEAHLQVLRQLSKSLSLQLIENGENLGIASALNLGIRRLQQGGCSLVFLFDQDSTITPGYIQAMLRCFHDAPPSLAILVPRYTDRRFGTTLPPPGADTANLEAATTSGSLLPLSIFQSAGFFAEELFIDGVDYEYSLRVRRTGHTIAECSAANLLHSPGSPTHHRLFRSRPFQAANYSPIRRFYQERNKIWVARRYATLFPGFCARQFLTSFKDLLKILLVEPSKLPKLRFFFRGIWHGLRVSGLHPRTGKLPER